MNIDDDKYIDFRDMCDDMALDKIKFDMIADFEWVEQESLKRGITTYEFILGILAKYDAHEKAVAWIKNRK